MNNHWQYYRDFDINDWIGFTYLIQNKVDNKFYIGKKVFWSTTHKVVKNRKNRKKVIKESDWKNYTGSCKSLNDDIERLGIDKFSFVITGLYQSRSQLAYNEVKNIIDNGALLSDQYYNGNTSPLKFKISEESELEREYNNHQIVNYNDF